MDITQKITLDLDRRSVYTTICAKQGDTKSRKVQITLVSGGAVYKPPSGAGAKFRAQKPDGTMVLNPAVVNSDGTVTVDLTRQTIAVPGEVTADVYLTDSTGSVLSSASFVIHVEPAPTGVQTDSENEFLHLVALVERAESASTTAGKQAQAAAASAQQAQEAERSATQIVQAAATHAGRRDNPHGVTAAQVGAAPAGYGLGVGSQLQNSSMWNGSGFFRTSTGTPNGIHIYGCQVDLWGNGQFRSLYGNNASDTYGCKLHRMDINGLVGEWEWVNPPMVAGVEYRTTERYKGKAVYTQLVNFGALPNSSRKDVYFNAEGSIETIVDIHLDAYLSTDQTNYSGYLAEISNFYASSDKRITIITNRDASDLTAYVTVKYTKK